MERNASRCDFKASCNSSTNWGQDKKKKKTSTVHRPVLALKIRLLKEIKNFGKALIKVRNYTLFPEICKIYAN